MQHVALGTTPRQPLGQGHGEGSNRGSSPLTLNPGGGPTPRSAFSDNEEFKGGRTPRNTKLTGEFEYSPIHPYGRKFKGPRTSINDSELSAISGHDEALDNLGVARISRDSTPANESMSDGARVGVGPKYSYDLELPISSSETSSQVRAFMAARGRELREGGELRARAAEAPLQDHVCVLEQTWNDGREVVEEVVGDPTPSMSGLGSIQFMGLTPGQSLSLTMFTVVSIGLAATI